VRSTHHRCIKGGAWNAPYKIWGAIYRALSYILIDQGEMNRAPTVLPY